jgi:hypothetical protein
VFVEDVLADEVRSFEFLAGQGTEPLVLSQLLSVGLSLKQKKIESIFDLHMLESEGTILY